MELSNKNSESRIGQSSKQAIDSVDTEINCITEETINIRRILNLIKL
jgi:hypothetical protein